MNLSDAAVTRATIPVDEADRAIAFYRHAPRISLPFAAPPMAPWDP